MAIINNVSTMIGARRSTVADVAKSARLSYEVVSRLYSGTSKRLDIETLDKLCRVLKCDVGDLFKYVPDEGASQ